VFGDSFADNGNIAEVPTGDIDRELVRSWYSPYGNSYGNDDGSYAAQANYTGRYSNYMVQSDFVGTYIYTLRHQSSYPSRLHRFDHLPT
jgi:hypothetical protein